jgi:hypothetical protein
MFSLVDDDLLDVVTRVPICGPYIINKFKVQRQVRKQVRSQVRIAELSIHALIFFSFLQHDQ